MIDYFVRHLRFPNRACKAVVVPNNDGSFDIYINTLFSKEEQDRALEHELSHLLSGHFYDELPAVYSEADVNGLPLDPPPPPPEKIREYKSLNHLKHYFISSQQIP